MAQKVRCRFAPSPTGKMHVGNLRSALYEFLIANMREVILFSALRTPTVSAMWKVLSILFMIH